VFAGQVVGQVAPDEEFVVQTVPFTAALHAPDAAHPEVHELFAYGVTDHEPLEQTGVLEADEQRAPERELYWYVVPHEVPLVAAAQAPEVAHGLAHDPLV